jgi:ssDNA thymidine ADP-ribosyltransferase, DarT
MVTPRAMPLLKGAEPGEPPKARFRFLYYITHVGNVRSILENGIFSHEQVAKRGIDFEPVYNSEIVNLRKGKTTPAGRSLWGYANLYLQPRNPMLYLVVRNFGVESLAVLAGLRGPAYETPGAFITDGNAASNETDFFPTARRRFAFDRIRSVDGLEYWKEEDGSKRRMMAEVLVPDRYEQSNLNTIYVATPEAKDSLDVGLASIRHPPIVAAPYIFFSPEYQFPLTRNLSLVRGDMFYSGMQTLTVSVNTMGVMGRGLASRAKYQFPDVYVRYQDSCRKRELKLGQPVLYKRESALDLELADDPGQLSSPNNQTWFLLFATKDDWRQAAKKEGIEAGLEWLVCNYKNEGIRSLAIPALGCGLGWLDWAAMGPILCRYLSQLEIPVQLYLPAERDVPADQLTKSFLLG